MAAPARCLVCRHENRTAIDTALVGGDSLRTIARRFGVDKDAINRHQKRHLAQTLASVAAARETARGETLLGQLQGHLQQAADMYKAAQKVLRRAERKRDPASMIAAIRASAVALGEQRATIELFSRLTGAMPRSAGTSTTVNVAVAVAGTGSGGPLVAKLSALIAGVREKQLPAGTEHAPVAGEADGEVITVEQAR